MRILWKLGLGLLTLAVIIAVGAAIAYGAAYRQRIYPGVSVGGYAVGDLTPAEAHAALAADLPAPETLGLDVVIGERTWRLSWAMVGQMYDMETAIDAAFAAGREIPWALGLFATQKARGQIIPIEPLPPDAERIKAFVDELAAAVYTAPNDARLSIAAGMATATPGQAGQYLDADSAGEAIAQALAAQESQLVLEPLPIPPTLPEPEPAFSQATALLSEPFVLVVRDPLTGDIDTGGYLAEFTAQPEVVATWFVPEHLKDAVVLHLNREAIAAWIEGVASQVGDERVLDVYENAYLVGLGLLQTGEHRSEARVRHPDRTYVVQPGDAFYDIAYSFGFPQWQLEKANPDVDPGLIDVGQELKIPSIDVLFPHPLVPGKRVEIDLPTQTLRAYQDDALLYEFKVSSGMSSTPTIAGQFQVLFKEPDAFADRWHLDMPFFMAFYEEGEGFHNGIHELPITSYGTRLSRSVLGWPASYGCIILDVGDAESLYTWADVGTLVRVIGVAPGTPFGQQTLSDIAPLVSDE